MKEKWMNEWMTLEWWLSEEKEDRYKERKIGRKSDKRWKMGVREREREKNEKKISKKEEERCNIDDVMFSLLHHYLCHHKAEFTATAVDRAMGLWQQQ